MTLQSQLSPKEVTLQSQLSPKEVTSQVQLSPKEVTSQVQLSPIQDRLSPKQVTVSSPKQVHTKDNKDIIQKICIVIFDLWNSQEIIRHRKLTEDIKRAVKTVLDTYSEKEICQAIRNYAEILKDESCYFKYRWTLRDFLKRGLEKFFDLDIAKANYRKDKLPIKGELLKEQLGPRGKPFEQYAKEQEEVS
ncbi:hypothetical protein ES703_100466 [subsurface metagenome]